ncbi:MAG: VWA domain-containing protein [Gammaproteobacteria bacterium]|nr:VWA domain-containing protein [Gammaproteobacteria bacterium]
MTSARAAILESECGDAVPLRGVSARGQLTGLLFELSVEQTYENTGDSNIEAVYTFPVPHHAVLLGLDLQIGDRKLSGVAVRKQAASRRYEKAMDEGHTACLLEEAGDGLYTLSLGNLLAGERAVIRYRYAELLDRHEDWVRLAIPTVIAPRYGDPTSHGVEAHQAPEVSLLASYPFALTVDVLGAQSAATLSSPSHRILVSDIENGKRVTLGAGAELDRDFILQLSGAVTASASLTTRSGDGWVSLLSLAPQIGEAASGNLNLNLKLVVDCSGSMGGDSIAQARRALLAILGKLQPADHVSITRFGSSFEHLSVGLIPATAPAIAQLSYAVREMEADLGGTELAGALQAAIGIRVTQDSPKNVLLITDGEVWAVEQVVDLAARSGHRLFVVAVGAAPAEGLARQLSARTGGACEFVSPNEDIEGAIVRMFQRMRQQPRQLSELRWPVTPDWQAPLPTMVFAGDTLHLLAGFSTPPVGETCLTISGTGLAPLTQRVTMAESIDAELLPRVAAARRLQTLPESEAATLAEAHQLVSKYTSFVVVQERAEQEKAEGLPELRKVAQMLAAGWGAAGKGVAAEVCMSPRPVPAMARAQRSGARNPTPAYDVSGDYEEPSFMRRAPGSLQFASTAERSPAEVLKIIGGRLEWFLSLAALPTTFAELAELGVPAALLQRLPSSADDDTHGEATLVRTLIALLAGSRAGGGLAPKLRTELIGDIPGNRDYRWARSVIEPLLADVSADAWDVSSRFDPLDTPAFLRRQVDLEPEPSVHHEAPSFTCRISAGARSHSTTECSPIDVLGKLATKPKRFLSLFWAPATLPKTFAELAKLGIPVELLAKLAANATNHIRGEATLVRTLIALLAHSPAGDGLTPTRRNELIGDIPRNQYYQWARSVIEPLLADVSGTAWRALSPKPDAELTGIE